MFSQQVFLNGSKSKLVNIKVIAELTTNSILSVYDSASYISPALSDRAKARFQNVLDYIIKVCPSFQLDVLSSVVQHEENKISLMHAIVYQEVYRIVQQLDKDMLITLGRLLSKASEFALILPNYSIYQNSDFIESSVEEQIEILDAKLSNYIQEKGSSVPKISVVLSFRIDHKYRLRNLLACMNSIQMQNIQRADFEIVAVEQDCKNRPECMISKYVDKYTKIENSGSYNYSWGRNVGANLASTNELLFFWDVDVIPDRDCLSNIYKAYCDQNAKVILPSIAAKYLDEYSTNAFLKMWGSGKNLEHAKFNIHRMRETYGMMIAVDKDLFYSIGGQDERYEGWGGEDNDFYKRLYEVDDPIRLAKDIYHLDHPRPAMPTDGKNINQEYIRHKVESKREVGKTEKYTSL